MLVSFLIIVGGNATELTMGLQSCRGVRSSHKVGSLSGNMMEIGAEIVNLLYPGQAMRDPGIARKRSDGLLYRMERSLQPPKMYARED